MAAILPVMRRVLASLLQFFPLTLFLRIAFLHGQPQADDWLHAFLAGGVAAILQFLVLLLLRRGRPLNRMMLGINAYLIVGALAVLGNQPALLALLNDLRESGIFLCLLAVGVITTWRSRTGFLGEDHAGPRSRMQVCSFWLLVLTCIATAASFYFRGQLLFSAVLPMIALVLMSKFLKKRLQRITASQDILPL